MMLLDTQMNLSSFFSTPKSNSHPNKEEPHSWRTEMTSSSSSTLTRPKILTDFSIDTIIGSNSSNSSSASLVQRLTPTTTTLRSNNNNDYKQHTNQHAITTQTRKYRPKNFQCFACKMAFSNNGQLKSHVRIHTGERPFRCNQQDCNKTFTRNEELTRHKLIHTGLRPHSCNICGKRFGRKDHLKKHVRTHERKKVFTPPQTANTFLQDVYVASSKPATINNQQFVSTDAITPIEQQLPAHIIDTTSDTLVNYKPQTDNQQSQLTRDQLELIYRLNRLFA